MAEEKKEKKEEKGEKPSEEIKPSKEVKEEKKEEVIEEKPKEEPKVEEKEEEQAPKPKEEPKPEKKPEPTGKYKDLIKQIESLSLADLSELVKELEERFGVSGIPVAPTTGLPSAPPTPGASTAPAEKVKFNLVLNSFGANKIAVIKAVREVKPDLGLKEAKDLVESLPKTLLENVTKEEVEKAKEKLESAGATVELK